jgi:hypothetical protein
VRLSLPRHREKSTVELRWAQSRSRGGGRRLGRLGGVGERRFPRGKALELYQNRRRLSRFAQSSEQNGAVPLSCS